MKLALTVIFATLLVSSAEDLGPHGLVRIGEGHRHAQSSVGRVTKIRVIDADKNQPIAGLDAIAGSVTIDLALLPTANLNIQALTDGTIGSVKWDAGTSLVRTENAAPWAFCGNSGNDFFSCTELVEGFNSTIKVTPYAAKYLKGEAGVTTAFAITIVQSRPRMNLTLIDANTDKQVRMLTNDTTINLAETPAVSIRADVPMGSSVRSVRFWYDGRVFRTENGAPYAINGNDGDDFFAFVPTIGCHNVTAKAFSDRDGRGSLRFSDTVIFCVESKTSSAPSQQPSSAPSPTPSLFPVALPIPYTCDIITDTCEYKADGYCDGGPDGTEYCDANTDCFDCDPCLQYAFTSCETCTSALEECLWCERSASCISPGTSVPDTIMCTTSDHGSTCTDSPPTGLFSDPFFSQMMWMYDMINVQEVWKAGVTGKGIGIRINDDGVDASHPEFSSKFDSASSCTLYTPEDSSFYNSHGTTCASLAAGSGNSSCSVGIAPDATLSGCRMIADEVTPEFDDRSYLHVKMDNMHVSSNSYGTTSCSKKRRRNLEVVQACPFLSTSPLSPCLSVNCADVDWSETGPSSACESDVINYCRRTINYEQDVQGCSSFLDLFVECGYNSPEQMENQAHIEGVTNGRNGKGIVYVYAAGNDFGAGDDVNFQVSQNSRYVMSVGAVGQDKIHSSYSTPGAALFVSAPGGDFETKPNNIVALNGGGCTDGGRGTSFACPVVSGVVALMLQVNNNLGWRDVQGIIASTSQKVVPTDISWTTNAAGLNHSYLYGFGLVDANAAVNAAKKWINYNPEQMIIAESGSVNVTIAEFQSPSVWASSSINVSAPASFKIEAVNVYLDLSHASRGDLDIYLVSPQGTSSLLAPGERPENSQLGDDERWKLMTVRNWGESPHGNWTLRLVDRKRGDLATCVNIPGYSVTIDFSFGTFPVTCIDLKFEGACVDGTQSPNYDESIFAEVATGINATMFTMANGLTAERACCACGGGKLASTVPDVLKSWRMAVYGSVD